MNVLEKILEEIEERVGFRERLVEYEERRGTITDVCRNKGALEELDIIARIIRFHMDEVAEDWVPVEERLPDKGIYVMCCFDDGAVDVLWQNWKEDKSLLFYADIDGEIRKAIAWQPVPEPYKPKKDNSATEHIMSRFMKVE